MRGLGHLPGATLSLPRGISGNGSVVVGYSPSYDGSFEAFRWTRNPLGNPVG
jgi:probable HAF family extracellular repeat protein